MSIHTDKAFERAREAGAFAGSIGHAAWNELASLSKRELIEIALRLGALSEGFCEDPQAGLKRIREEHRFLKDFKII